ncbi:Rha family transcriptional regulator [Kurthia sp. Dielmo]|uniref:Rha family transcriptional regulator n=1 Tax=Kurthia sp. Dielmo TaxID=1033738 RepID=UPI00112097D0|nr:Rha family transcriptional regulator [Kurthia sp. Dielmo]
MTNQVTHTGKVISSLEVAEMVGREHKNVMRDIEKIRTDLNALKVEPVKYFAESTYKGGNGQERSMFLLTKQGCELYGNRMTGIEGTAFAVKYVERFEQMERVIQHNLPTDPLELALTAALETRKEVAEIKEDVDFLKDNMRINTYQEKQLQDIVKRKVMSSLGGYKSTAYEMLANKAFKSAWRDFKNHFGISTYKELPATKFDEGIQLLGFWEPSASMKFEIAAYNTQPAGATDSGWEVRN